KIDQLNSAARIRIGLHFEQPAVRIYLLGLRMLFCVFAIGPPPPHLDRNHNGEALGFSFFGLYAARTSLRLFDQQTRLRSANLGHPECIPGPPAGGSQAEVPGGPRYSPGINKSTEPEASFWTGGLSGRPLRNATGDLLPPAKRTIVSPLASRHKP